MAGLSETEIANMALGVLTESPIDSLDEDIAAARLVRLHFDNTREAELKKRAWVFATQSATVAPIDSADLYWPYSYALPADCLRVLPLMQSDVEIDWQVKGGAVLTRWGGSRAIDYIANLVDPNDWDALFNDVLAAAIAIKIAHPLTGKTTMVDVARQVYKDAVREAVRNNAIQKRGRAPSRSWEAARAGHGASPC